MTLDENSWYLRNYHDQQDLLESQYLASLPEKKDEIIALAQDILQGTASDDEIHQAFCAWFDGEKGDYNPLLLSVLDDWNANELDYEDIEIMEHFAKLSLEAATEIILGDSLDNVSDEGYWDVNQMVKELVGDV